MPAESLSHALSLRERGRPSLYTHEIAAEILSRLSAGEPLEKICRDEHMPASRTVYLWKKQDAAFSADFARAREDGYDAIAMEALDIADDSSRDVIETERGPKLNSEFAARSRLRVETRLKLLAKWSPKKYGEKLDVTGIPGAQTNIILPLSERIAKAKAARSIGADGKRDALPQAGG